MTRGDGFWICLQCGKRIDDAALAGETSGEAYGNLPSLLAIPLAEYAAESHPVMRLHRLCDAVEVLTRFFTVVALGELRCRLGDEPLPKSLLEKLQPSIERPTFGQWREMLRAIVAALEPGDPLVVPELPEFVTDQLLPGLSAEPREPERNLVELRNRAVHGGAMTRATAKEFLNTWQTWLEEILQQLDFFDDCEVCHYTERTARKLLGTQEAAGPAIPLSTDLESNLEQRQLDGHVLLLRGYRWLDLWPLCDYGCARTTSLAGERRSSTAGPLVYIRAERDRLLYAALGVNLSQGERADVADEFRSLFRLEERVPGKGLRLAADYEDEIRADSQSLVGRVTEIRQAKAAVKASDSGVLWISGPGGIGKSYLLARLADDLRGDPKKVLRIAWRFKASDTGRCNRAAFFRHAIGRLADWSPLESTEIIPSDDPAELFDYLRGLLQRAAELQAAHPRDRPPRVLLVLDGMDEIARSDDDFPNVPFRLNVPNVVWLCAGRPEGKLPEIFAADRSIHVFPATDQNPNGGLPAMLENDIRGMLLDGTDKLKYELLALDQEPSAGAVPANAAVQAVIERARGLPLYVHLVIEDILSGQFRFQELQHRLPPSLDRYYDELLKRLSIGALQALLTPLVVTICHAKAPLDEKTLHLLMVRRTVVTKGGEGQQLVRQGLAAVQSMVRAARIPRRQGFGYEPYHETFRQHVLTDSKQIIGQQNPLTRDALCAMVCDWSGVPADHPARDYVLHHGPQHLVDAERWDELEALLTDIYFLQAKNEVGLVFDLAGDFTAAVAALPEDRPGRRILALLNKALQRDIHFIARHAQDYPQGLFQCLWNSGWWYDCPAAAQHYLPLAFSGKGREAPGLGAGLSTAPHALAPCLRARQHDSESPAPLYALLESWRTQRNEATSGLPWLRALRPPLIHLGAAQLAVLRGHQSSVESVAFSPGGDRIVSGSRDHTLRLWDAASGAEVAVLRGHKKIVNSVAFSPGGDRIVSGSRDDTVRVWDATSGAEVAKLHEHESWVNSVAFSPGGDRIVSGSRDQTVRIWDAASGEGLAVLRGHESSVMSVAFSPGGDLVASGSLDQTVRLWDVQSGAELAVLSGHVSEVHSVAFSPGGDRIVSGSRDDTARVWDVASFAQLAVLRGHENDVRSVAFSPGGDRIASGSPDRTVRVWDATRGTELAVLRGHENAVYCVAFSAGGDRIVSGGGYPDMTVRVWAATIGVELGALRGHEHYVRSVAFSPGGDRIVSGSWDRTVRLWDARSGEELVVFRGHENYVSSVAFSPGGDRIVSRSEDKTVRVWDAASGVELAVLRGHESWVDSVAFSPNGDRIVSGSRDNTARVWDAASGAELAVLRGHESWVNSVAFSPCGDRIVSGARDKTVRVWDAASGAELAVLREHQHYVSTVAYSPCGDRIVSGSENGTVRVWDAVSGAELAVLRGHERLVESVAFSPSGDRIVSGSQDRTVRVWDGQTGQCLKVIPGPGDVYLIAREANESPLRALARGQQTIIEQAGTRQPIAWFPVALPLITTHPDGRNWAGSVGNHVYILTLEGEPEPPDPQHEK
jgi:WD40 repeat protein